MHVTNKGRVLSLALAAVFAAGSLLALDIDKLPPDNWAVPSSRAGIRTTMTDATSPRAFIGLTPCRIVDTRGNGAPIQGGTFGVNQIRTWALSGKCGIPTGADAVSLNLTVTGTGANPFGFATLWPTGATQPTASNINWSAAGQTIANAVIVPLGTSGSVNVISGNAGTDMVLDVNGYFSAALGTPQNFFTLNNNSSLWTLNTFNAATGCSGLCGILAQTSSGNAFEGDSFQTSGLNHAVSGFNASTTNNSAGVFGVSGSAAGSVLSFFPVGVRGESDTGNGVIGITAGASSIGVRGDRVDSGGATLTSGILGGSAGVVFTGGLSGSGTKAFVEPHPTDATKMIRYVSLEGPEAGTYFRGTAQTVGGRAVIQVPESFRMVTDSDGLTVQLTATGGRFAQMVVESSDLNQIVVLSNRDVTFHYLAQGVRRAYKNIEVITDNLNFAPESPSDRMPISLSADERQRLIDNGTYNPDGSVNMKTADSAGWTKAWAAREEAARKSAEAAVAAKKAQIQRQQE